MTHAADFHASGPPGATGPGGEDGRLLRRATSASVATASVLIVAKLAAWLATGSVTVLASLIDSLMDVAASLVNLMAVRYSLKAADEEHKWGHGKAESLAGLGQASFIAGSALFLIMQAAERLAKPQPLAYVTMGLGVMVFAMVCTLLLLAYQRHVIRRTRSMAIRADALHYATDILTNLATMAALALATMGWGNLDPVFAMGISVYILYSAWKIGYEAIQMLMDRELPEEVRDTICEVAMGQRRVLGVHDIRTRQAGRMQILQLHLELDDQMPLAEAHAVAKEVEAAILARYPEADITIHQDPVGVAKKAGVHSVCVRQDGDGAPARNPQRPGP